MDNWTISKRLSAWHGVGKLSLSDLEECLEPEGGRGLILDLNEALVPYSV